MKPLLRIGVFFLGCVLAAGAAAAEGPASWDMDPDHSTVGFRIQHIVGYVPGVFARFSGDVEYDPQAPEASQFYLLIDSASVHTGVPARDEHLRSADFLDVARAPRIIFSSRRVERLTGNMLNVVGDLTIKDVTAEIVVPVRILGIADHPFTEQMPDTRVLGLHAAFSINRLDFHVGEEKWTSMGVMGDRIDLAIDMELLQR